MFIKPRYRRFKNENLLCVQGKFVADWQEAFLGIAKRSTLPSTHTWVCIYGTPIEPHPIYCYLMQELK